MLLEDLRFLLVHLSDLRNQTDDDFFFLCSEQFRDLDEEQQAQFKGEARGRRFQLRELESIDLEHQEQADAWLGAPAYIRKALGGLPMTDLPPHLRRKVQEMLREEK